MAVTINDHFLELKQAVLAKRPILGQILQKHGADKLWDYTREYADVNLSPILPERQLEMLAVVGETVASRFGAVVADSVTRQLKKYYFVSTADHVGPINHPFFVNSNLLIAAGYENCQDSILQNIVVFACAKISVDNSSFPRGLFFHTVQNNQLQQHRLSFFSGNFKPSTVYTLPAYQKKDFDKMVKTLSDMAAKGEITAAIHDKINSLITDLYDREELYKRNNYLEQIAITNFDLWHKLFNVGQVKLPNLIYLELEDIVVKLITKFHLNQDTIINHIIFDHAYEHYISNYFENIFGSFSRQDSSGTYLFWALPPGARHKLQLWKEGSKLVSQDRSYKIDLEPQAIREALERKELIPGLLMSFITVSFYYGLKCLGGFNQVNYLTMMKNGYIKMNVDLENYRSIEVCARAQTKEICDGLAAAFLGFNNNQTTLASGLDLCLYHDDKSWPTILQLIRNITLDEALSPLMPEIYRISYQQNEWKENLLAVTSKGIIDLIGVDKKITPCAHIL